MSSRHTHTRIQRPDKQLRLRRRVSLSCQTIPYQKRSLRRMPHIQLTLTPIIIHHGQSILRLELLDVQCRGNLWQDLPCLCPLLVSGEKRPNQRSWQVDRELQEWLWKKVLNLKHFGEYALGPEHSASWASRCSMPRESLARPPLLVPIADFWCQAAEPAQLTSGQRNTRIALENTEKQCWIWSTYPLVI